MIHHRYLAAIGEAADPEWCRIRMAVEASLRGQGWAPVLIADDLILLAVPDVGALVLDQGDGAILGRLFAARHPHEPLAALARGAQHAIVASRGRALIDDYWGGYLAVLRDPRDGRIHVVRDPSSSLPCYHVHLDSVTLIASDIAALVATGLYQPVLDRGAIARHLIVEQVRTSETCLAGVRELLGGSRLTTGVDGVVVEALWTPAPFIGRGDQIVDQGVAAAALRETVLACTGAWARSFGHIILGVSGGLDSSIVAAALASAGARFSCLTLATRDPVGDERGYARLLAAALDRPLVEAFEDVARVQIGRSDAAHLPRPTARLFAQSGDRMHQDVADLQDGDVFFSGGGGDNVFCYLQSGAPVADRVMAEGLNAGALQTLSDISTLAGSSIWAVAHSAMRAAIRRSRPHRWSSDQSLIDPMFAARAVQPDHPWLRGIESALPGKQAHIRLLLHIQNHLEGYGREVVRPTIFPLLSQPVVELCLRIPSWLWCRGGVNRAVARTAFADHLPQQLLARRSKGTPGGFAAEIYLARKEEITLLLDNGVLAEMGLIDLDAIRAVTLREGPLRDLAHLRILRLVDAETWCRSWRSQGAQVLPAPVPRAVSCRPCLGWRGHAGRRDPRV